MQVEKSKKILSNLMDIADSTINMFYLAATSGLVSNKMSCIEFSFELLYETSRSYNLFPKDCPFMQSANTAIQKMTNDVDSIEYTFGVLFNSIQQYKMLLTSWLSELSQSPA